MLGRLVAAPRVTARTPCRRMRRIVSRQPERTLERVPIDWAATQVRLGTALCALGVRNGDIDSLHSARTAVSAAQEVYQKTGQTRWDTDIPRKIGSHRRGYLAPRVNIRRS